MDGETIIAATLGLVGGGGGSRLLKALGPTRKRDTVAYYRGVAEQLEKENTRLWKRVRGLVETIEEQGSKIDTLQRQVAQIAAGELPPEYS